MYRQAGWSRSTEHTQASRNRRTGRGKVHRVRACGCHFRNCKIRWNQWTASMQEIGSKQLALYPTTNQRSADFKISSIQPDIKEKTVIHYLVDLNRRQVGYSVICQVSLLQEWHSGVATVFTDNERNFKKIEKSVANRDSQTITAGGE